MWLLLVGAFVRILTRAPASRVHRTGGRIPSPSRRVSTSGRRAAMAPQALMHFCDSILYLSSLLRDQPRQIDRYIDYFGGEVQVAFAQTRRHAAEASASLKIEKSCNP